jgi:hypothetical protein
MSGVWEQEDEDTANCILSGLMGLEHNKYGDLILLCSVTVAFGMLLVVSAIG